ncbi:hypothetical protein [Methylobacterium sp. ID0610]|uniref:hypothetical protein n=1 Tax=Methylobacterium carpenticola TaxID=3344827 RepID=UPI00367F9F28
MRPGRAAWDRVPILTRADLTGLGRRLRTTNPARRDARVIGDGAEAPARRFPDQDHAAAALAFRHAAAMRAGIAAHAERAVFLGLDIGGPSHMREEADDLRRSILHLTDAAMTGYRRAIIDRRITVLDGDPSALAIVAAFLLRWAGPARRRAS